jgi:hypothetical protein
MKYRSILSVLLMFLIAAMPLTLSAAPPPTQGAGINIPVTGTFAPSGATTGPLSTLGTGTVTGVLDIQKFVNNNGTLTAVGTLTTQLTSSTGAVTNLVQQFSAPVISATGACPILHLDLGPLNLDLLGLQISLNQVVLDIVAQSGPGNLLGNLLCAVANLLNGGGPLGAIANLLNQILAILNGLLG